MTAGNYLIWLEQQNKSTSSVACDHAHQPARDSIRGLCRIGVRSSVGDMLCSFVTARSSWRDIVVSCMRALYGEAKWTSLPIGNEPKGSVGKQQRPRRRKRRPLALYRKHPVCSNRHVEHHPRRRGSCSDHGGRPWADLLYPEIGLMGEERLWPRVLRRNWEDTILYNRCRDASPNVQSGKAAGIARRMQPVSGGDQRNSKADSAYPIRQLQLQRTGTPTKWKAYHVKGGTMRTRDASILLHAACALLSTSTALAHSSSLFLAPSVPSPVIPSHPWPIPSTLTRTGSVPPSSRLWAKASASLLR